MTVSKALRDAPDIAASTKAQLRQLALEMGYTPDSLAQGLRCRKTHLFGLVIPASTNPIFARTILALDEHAFEMGYDLLTAHSLNLPEREETVLRRMLSRRVEGLFIAPVYRLAPTAPVYDELRKRQTPTVLLGGGAAFCEGFACVEVDDFGASLQATRHLLELGHRRIAFFAGTPAAPYATARLEGYRRALREAGIQPDDRLVFNAGATIEEGEHTALQMLQETSGVTAVQAAHDLTAIGVANVLLGQGLRVPGDVSLVGFGNVLLSEHFRVAITTVRQPKYSLGVAAIELMRQLLKGEPAKTVRLPAELIIRQSTAPPPRGAAG